MKKLLAASIAMVALMCAVYASPSLAAEAVGVLDENRFVVVSQGGKSVTLYEVRGGKLNLLDSVIFTEIHDRIVIDQKTLKPVRLQERRN